MTRGHRRATALALALGLLLGACASDGAEPGNQPRAGAGSAVAPDDEPAPSDGDTPGDERVTTGDGASPSAEPAEATTQPDGQASTPASGASPADTGASPSPDPAPVDAPGTAPGTYEYDVEAASQAGTFPRRESTYTLTSVVEPVDGDGHQRTTATPQDESGQQGEPTEQTIAHSDTELRLAYLRSPGQGGDDDGAEFRPDPPVLLATTTATPGDSWSWSMTSTDGDLEVDASLEVTRTETRTVGGTEVATLVLRSVLEFRGDGFEGTEESTTWFSPEHRITVREESSMSGQGTFNGQRFDFESEEQRVLRSLQPA